MGKKKLPPVHAIVVLDRSGSMTPVQAATVEGLGQYVGDLKADEGGPVILSLLQFDHEHEWLISAAPVGSIDAMPHYSPRGWTALNDAIMLGIARGDEAEARGEKPLLIIVTDGGENYSIEHPGEAGKTQIKAMLGERQERGWVVTYLSADLSSPAWQQGAAYGVPLASSAAFAATSDSVSATMAAVSTVTRSHSSSRQGLSGTVAAFADSGIGNDYTQATPEDAEKIRSATP